MSSDLSKEVILQSYLNSVPFGRQTYGIEAAAQAFFNKTAKRTAPPEQQLTLAEAMVLVAMVKQPNPNPDDPKGQPATTRPTARRRRPTPGTAGNTCAANSSRPGRSPRPKPMRWSFRRNRSGRTTPTPATAWRSRPASVVNQRAERTDPHPGLAVQRGQGLESHP